MTNKKVNQRFSCFPRTLGSQKKAVIGGGIITIYRLVLISLIAFIILGLSAVFYDYYIDVRDAEARVLARSVVNCLAPEGVFDLDSFLQDKEDRLLDYCGIKNTGRFYINISLIDSSGEEIKKLEYGDSGAMWVRVIFEDEEKTEEIGKYKSGYFNEDYNVFIEHENEKLNGTMFVEVLVSHEF